MTKVNRTGFASEAELAAAVVEHLRAEGFEVYQEVEGYGGVADIVAVRGDRVRVVECKLVFGADVLGQAWGWQSVAHEVCIATPPGRYGRGTGGAFLRAAARELGIGIYEVSRGYQRFDGQPRSIEVRLPVEPREQTANASKLLASLREEHKTYAAAGSPTGHRWTKFRESERNLVEHVRAHPGELTRVVMKAVKHHWRGKYPASRVRVLIERGIITAVRVEESPEGTRFYPVEEAAASAPATAVTQPTTKPPPRTAVVVPARRGRRRRARRRGA